MAKIRVPKPPADALNKDRRISELLKSQLKHMQEVEKHLPAHHQTRTNIDAIKTEREAAKYIRTITAKLHRRRHHVPKTPSSAGNKHRPVSDLLKSQVQHFREIEKAWPKDKQTGIDVAKLKTESDASSYIRKITAILHPQGAGKPSK